MQFWFWCKKPWFLCTHHFDYCPVLITVLEHRWELILSTRMSLWRKQAICIRIHLRDCGEWGCPRTKTIHSHFPHRLLPHYIPQSHRTKSYRSEINSTRAQSEVDTAGLEIFILFGFFCLFIFVQKQMLLFQGSLNCVNRASHCKSWLCSGT